MSIDQRQPKFNHHLNHREWKRKISNSLIDFKRKSRCVAPNCKKQPGALNRIRRSSVTRKITRRSLAENTTVQGIDETPMTIPRCIWCLRCLRACSRTPTICAIIVLCSDSIRLDPRKVEEIKQNVCNFKQFDELKTFIVIVADRK